MFHTDPSLEGLFDVVIKPATPLSVARPPQPDPSIQTVVVDYEREEVAACDTDPFFHQFLAKGGNSRYAVELLEQDEIMAVFAEMCPHEPAWGVVYESRMFDAAEGLIEGYCGGFWPTYAVFDRSTNARVTWFRVLQGTSPVNIHWEMNFTRAENVDPAVAGLIAHMFGLAWTCESLKHMRSWDEFTTLRDWFFEVFPNEASLVIKALD